MPDTDRSEALGVYLNDHLGLLTAEGELIDRVASANEANDFGVFLSRYRSAVAHQHNQLEQLMATLDTEPSSVKQAAGWVAEKLGRLKPNNAIVTYTDVARLLESEALILSAEGRKMMWSTLQSRWQQPPLDIAKLLGETDAQLTELARWRQWSAEQLKG